MFTYIVINCLLTLPAFLACHCLTLFASFFLYIFGTLCAIFTYACFVFGMQHVAMSNNTLYNDAAAAAVSVSAFSASSAVDVECRRRCVALHARHREHIVLHFESNMSRITSPAPTTPPHIQDIPVPIPMPRICNQQNKLLFKIERTNWTLLLFNSLIRFFTYYLQNKKYINLTKLATPRHALLALSLIQLTTCSLINTEPLTNSLTVKLKPNHPLAKAACKPSNWKAPNHYHKNEIE